MGAMQPDVLKDFHRRLAERFVFRPEGDQPLTDAEIIAAIDALPQEEREKIREVRRITRRCLCR